MIKKILTLSILTAISGTSAMAQTIGSTYGELGYTTVTGKTGDLTFNPTAARVTLGTVVDSNVALEGFYATGMGGDSNKYNSYGTSVNLEIKVNNLYGFAVRPFYNVSSNVEIFGRIGNVWSKFDGTASAGTRQLNDSTSSSDVFYGVGLAFKLDDNWKAVVDYSKIKDSDDSMMAIGLRYNF